MNIRYFPNIMACRCVYKFPDLLISNIVGRTYIAQEKNESTTKISAVQNFQILLPLSCFCFKCINMITNKKSMD